jgi:adenylate cyclase, class 2
MPAPATTLYCPMLEVELKFPVPSFDDLSRALRDLAAVEKGSAEQVDQYFAHPMRDFAETDEALRIRRVGEQNFVTYKGPKVDATTKTRREIELSLARGRDVAEGFAELLDALGFRPVATVRKSRTTYTLTWQSRPVEIALDSVDGLGTFVEIETAAAGESDLDGARDAVNSLAQQLGLEASERRSYLEMLL